MQPTKVDMNITGDRKFDYADHYTRKGKSIIAYVDGGDVRKVFKSCNEAKRISRRLQQTHDGALGRGSVRVVLGRTGKKSRSPLYGGGFKPRKRYKARYAAKAKPTRIRRRKQGKIVV